MKTVSDHSHCALQPFLRARTWERRDTRDGHRPQKRLQAIVCRLEAIITLVKCWRLLLVGWRPLLLAIACRLEAIPIIGQKVARIMALSLEKDPLRGPLVPGASPGKLLRRRAPKKKRAKPDKDRALPRYHGWSP